MKVLALTLNILVPLGAFLFLAEILPFHDDSISKVVFYSIDVTVLVLPAVSLVVLARMLRSERLHMCQSRLVHDLPKIIALNATYLLLILAIHICLVTDTEPLASLSSGGVDPVDVLLMILTFLVLTVTPLINIAALLRSGVFQSDRN